MPGAPLTLQASSRKVGIFRSRSAAQWVSEASVASGIPRSEVRKVEERLFDLRDLAGQSAEVHAP
jgi:hypothetical protein